MSFTKTIATFFDQLISVCKTQCCFEKNKNKKNFTTAPQKKIANSVCIVDNKKTSNKILFYERKMHVTTVYHSLKRTN